MPKKVPLVSIGVARDGKTVFPAIGEPFEFTDAEVSDMSNLKAKTGIEYFRNPVNETVEPEAKSKKSGKSDTSL